MKYSEILHFEPLTDLIQLDKLSEPEYRMDVVKNFVYPDYFINTTIISSTQPSRLSLTTLSLALGTRKESRLSVITVLVRAT